MSTLSSRVAVLLLPFRSRWSALSVRDRRALALMGAVLLLALAWLLLVAPVRDFAGREVQRLADEQQNLEWMQANGAVARQAGRRDGTGNLPDGQSLLAAINASAAGAGLNLQRFEPDGERRVRVTLENAVFADLMGWTVDIERRHGIRVVSLNADSAGQPGRVNVRLTLERSDT